MGIEQRSFYSFLPSHVEMGETLRSSNETSGVSRGSSRSQVVLGAGCELGTAILEALPLPQTFSSLKIDGGVSINKGTPKWMVYKWKTLLKWMIWGYPYFRKHPWLQDNPIFWKELLVSGSVIPLVWSEYLSLYKPESVRTLKQCVWLNADHIFKNKGFGAIKRVPHQLLS